MAFRDTVRSKNEVAGEIMTTAIELGIKKRA